MRFTLITNGLFIWIMDNDDDDDDNDDYDDDDDDNDVKTNKMGYW